MKAHEISSTSMKKFPTKSSGTTMAQYFDESNRSCGFRLKRRYNSLASVSKDTAVKKRVCYGWHRSSSSYASNCDESSTLQTPCSVKSIEVPPELRLPSFDADGRMQAASMKHRSDRRDYSGVSFDLNEFFDAVAHLQEDDCFVQ